MPEFFSPKELSDRNRDFQAIIKQCTTVLISSKDAQNDLAEFDHSALPSSRILNFVSGFEGSVVREVNEESLRLQYGIVGPYLHLPNQFWIHKNHRAVIDALGILKKRGRQILVVCTGHTKDHRWPNYFDELIQHAVEQDVVDFFRVLGLVPYDDMVSLMKYSVGVINPSLFEGWSTTVEEAKSLGLKIVLSNIPVHREQNPERGVFFDPVKPESLADALANVSDQHNHEAEEDFQRQAKLRQSRNFSLYGCNYQTIALETISRNVANRKIKSKKNLKG